VGVGPGPVRRVIELDGEARLQSGAERAVLDPLECLLEPGGGLGVDGDDRDAKPGKTESCLSEKRAELGALVLGGIVVSALGARPALLLAGVGPAAIGAACLVLLNKRRHAVAVATLNERRVLHAHIQE
jgi:hypothetical protein